MMKLLQRHAMLLTTFSVTVASSLPWLAVITGPRAWASLLLATSVGTWLGYMATSRKKRFFLVSPGGNILALLAVLVFVSLDAPWNIGDLVQGFLNGFARLSTTVLPATSTNGLLVSPIVVVAVVAWMVGRFEGTRPGSLKSLFPWLANFLGATAFGATYNGATRILGIVLAVCLLSWLVLKSQRSRTYVERDPDESRIGRALASLSPMVVMSVLATGLIYGQSQLSIVDGSAVGLDRQAPNTLLNGANPSIVLATLRYSGSTESLFEVRLTQPLPALNGTKYSLLPIATLSKYDGNTWSLENLQPVNGGAAQLVAHANGWKRPAGLLATTIDVTVRAAADNMNLNHYFPTPGGFLRHVVGTDVAADSASGFGVSAEALSTGATISVTGTSNTFGPPAVSGASAQMSPRVCQALMTTLKLTQIGTGCSFKPVRAPLEVVTSLVKSLHDFGGRTPISSSAVTDNTGQSFLDLDLTVRGSEHMGTSEQYATYVALAARLVGLPSRIVTGFRISSDATTASLTPANSYTWAEVYSKGGWHVQDATPTREGKGSARSGAITVQPPESDPSGSSSCAQTSCNTVIHPYAPRGTGNRLLQLLVTMGKVTGGVALLLIVWSGVVSLLKRRRRRARRRGTAPQQVRGAITELLALRRELGQSPRLTSASATELVETVRREIADGDEEAGDAIVDQVNIAYYSVTPKADLPVEDVWEWVDWVTKEYKKLSSRRSSLRARLYYTRQLS
jgi:hypothetical protein